MVYRREIVRILRPAPKGLADAFDMTLVCNPWMLYNGHHSKEPYMSGALFGCHEDGSATGEQVLLASRDATFAKHHTINTSAPQLSGLLLDKEYNLSSTAAEPVVFIVRRCVNHEKPSQVDLWPNAAGWLYQQFHAASDPEAYVQKHSLWPKQLHSTRVAVHWRTAKWSVDAMGAIPLPALGKQALKDLGVDTSSAAVNLITAWKENEEAQDRVKQQMEDMKAVFPQAVVLDSTQTVGESTGADVY
eukprot:gene4177-760_t